MIGRRMEGFAHEWKGFDVICDRVGTAGTAFVRGDKKLEILTDSFGSFYLEAEPLREVQ